ncbi:MAG: nitroreductase family protein [Desulfitobacterium sp.]
MAIKDFLQKRRSIRKYTNIPIEKEKVDQLIRSALLSPTSRNGRPWEFILVEDRDLLERLSRAKAGAQFLKEATLGIVVCADSQKSDVWVEDISIATILIQLQAQDLGLGSCWIQIRERNYQDGTPAGEYVKKLLGIPEHLQVGTIIALGYPAETRPEHLDGELQMEKIHRDTY